MKKGWKRFWIICGIVAGIGLVCCVISLGMGLTTNAIRARFPNGIEIIDGIGIHWGDDDDDYNHHESTYEGAVAENSEDSYSQVYSIEADVWGVELQVVKAPEGQSEVTVTAENVPEKLKLRHYMEDGELKIETDEEVWSLKNAGYVGTLVLSVPAGYQFQEVSLACGAGTLYIEDIQAQELSLDIGASEAEIINFVAQEADITCGAGAVYMTGLAERNIDFECGAGEVEFTVAGKQVDYNYELECGLGELICGTEEYSGIASSKTINHNVPKNMSVECGLGSVIIDFTE